MSDWEMDARVSAAIKLLNTTILLMVLAHATADMVWYWAAIGPLLIGSILVTWFIVDDIREIWEVAGV